MEAYPKPLAVKVKSSDGQDEDLFRELYGTRCP